MPLDMLQRIVRKAERDGIDSPYLDRLRLRIRSLEASHRQIELEIIAEMAAALGRAEDKVNTGLLELEVLGRAIDAAPEYRRGVLIVEFNRIREEAFRARRDLMIHREAVGLRNHDEIFDTYPVPPER